MSGGNQQKDKEYTIKQSSFLSVLFEPVSAGGAGGNIRQAMDLAGYSRQTTVHEVINPLSDDISDLAIKYVSSGAGEAVLSLFEILRQPNTLGAANKLKAAQMILDRAGVTKKTEEDVNLKVPQGGLVILPAKNPRDNDSNTEEGDKDEEV